MLNSRECYHELVDYGANVSAVDVTGKTALQMATVFNRNF